MIQIVAKVWGFTTELFTNNTTSVHILDIKAGGYCSEHKHTQKDNIFHIVEGELEVTSWIGCECYIDVFKASEECIIPIGVWHKFHALTDVKCIEIYDYKYDGVDIERRTVGGRA